MWLCWVFRFLERMLLSSSSEIICDLNVSFREPEPYFSEEVSTPSLQGKNSTEENMLQKDDGVDEFLKLEEVIERLGRSGKQSLKSIHEVLVHSENESESPMNTELPILTPLTL